MRPPVCTIDASCVIALDHLNLLPQLSFLFSRVLLPRAVRTELFRRRATKDRLRATLREYTFIERCDDYDRGAVDLLLVERMVQGIEDRGETEAVVQATKIGAIVIVDDPWGRGLAERFGREFHGTIWVLRRFFNLGLASGPVTKGHFVELRNRGIRLPLAAVNDFLVEIGETPIVPVDEG
jgi:predicted nucleic acid-binding protein